MRAGASTCKTAHPPYSGPPPIAEEMIAGRINKEKCAFCGAVVISAHRFHGELQYLDLDEAMAISGRPGCPFSDEQWHREVEELEAAATGAAGVYAKKRLWSRAERIIKEHSGEVASYNEALETEFGF